jgi:hypothetical protein
MLERELAEVQPLNELGEAPGWPEPALSLIDFPVRECD